MTEKETLDWCKRVNTDKAKELGRLLSRISCSNPLVSFDIVISNLRAYGNLIDPTLVALNYCSKLSMDCMAFTILRQMTDYNENKIENTGTISVWVQNITSFAGQFLKRHHSVDLNAIFIYLLNHIKLGQVPEMRLLRDIVMFMSGWVSLDLTEMTKNQIECLAGGFLLRIEASEYTEKLRSSKYSERSLRHALMKEVSYIYTDENGEKKEGSFTFAFLFMALVGRTSKTLLFNNQSTQLRFLGSRHDELHLLSIQLNEFLMFAERHQSSYQNLLPSNPLHVLTRTFNMHPEQVFNIIRPCLKPLYELSEEEQKTKVAEFKDVLDYYLEENAKCKGTDCSDDYFEEKKYLEDQKEKVWGFITPEFYMLFWYLQLSDIHCPVEKYDQAMEKIQARDVVVDPDMSKKKKLKIDKQKKKSIASLKEEKDKIMKNIDDHEKFIKSNCDSLLTKIISKNVQNIRVYVIQYLVHPRMMSSPRDAMFVIKFIVLLTKLKTPYFNLIGLIGFILKEVLPCILCCTEKESHNFGIFFLELFKTLKHWQNRNNWEKECSK